MIKKTDTINNEHLLLAINSYKDKEFKSILQFVRFLYDNYYEYLNIHDENGKKIFDENATYTGAENNDYRYAVDIVRKEVTKNLKDYDCRNSKFLYAYCIMFECSADYLLGFIDLPTHVDTDIYNETGLNEESIQTLREIQLSDKNENSITIFPKNLYNKMINNEKMTPEESEEFERILSNTPEENIKPYPSNRPKLMDLLNFMLSNSLDIESLLMAFRNLVNPFTVPVFYDDNNGWTFPDNQWSKNVGFNGHVTYTINLASNEKNPADNLPIWVDKNFIESVNMKSIERIFSTFYDKYKNQNKSSNQK